MNIVLSKHKEGKIILLNKDFSSSFILFRNHIKIRLFYNNFIICQVGLRDKFCKNDRYIIYNLSNIDF